MRVAALVATLLALGTAAAHGASQPGSVSAKLSSTRAGVRPVAITLALHTELQCGRLVGAPLVVRLPAAEQVPTTIAASSVRVGRLASGGVAVRGHALTVTLPRVTGILCDSLTVGTLDVVLTRAANLGNPALAGSYALVVQRGGELFKARFTIR